MNIKTTEITKTKMKEDYEMTEEDLFYTRILDEAIESFNKNPETISFEEFFKELEEELNIDLSD